MKTRPWQVLAAFLSVACVVGAAAPGECAPPKKWDRTADVVVVGGGGAGLAAAVAAAEKKASVIVLEKMPMVGGNTIISGGGMNAVDPERQGRQGIEDSIEKHFRQTIAAGDYRGDPEKVKILTSQGLDAVKWLEGYGMKFKDNVIEIFGSLHPRTHMPLEAKGLGYIRTLKAAADKHGVKTFTETKVDEIIREKRLEGRVLGVRATDRAGRTVHVRAKKAVVLAAGGFGANRELRARHDPRLRDITTTNGPQATGEVLLQAIDIGGYPVGMDHIQCNPGAPPGRTLRVILHIDVSRYIMVDKRGKRFVAEDGRRDVIRDSILNLPEQYGFSVVDVDGFNVHDEVSRKTVMKGIETGDAFKADTIEELAQKMGVPVDAFVETVKKYNAFVDARNDADFGRKEHNLKKIEKAPFYSCLAGMSVHHTMGGLDINTRAQVLDRHGKVIPALYAAGEITGGIHGANRVGGNAIPDIIVFGRIAGANAAAEK